jgi:alpha/beta superfamily hydrolase
MGGEITTLLLVQRFEQNTFIEQLARTLVCHIVHDRPVRRPNSLARHHDDDALS